MAQAHSYDLSGQQIHELVTGTTVEIDTPTGTKLPIRYGRDGKLSGDARDLAWYLGASVDNGRWWVTADELCHRWSHWFSSEPQCMRLSREGRTIRWRSRDGYEGTAAVSVPAPIQAAAVAALVPPSRPKPPAPPAVAAATPPSPPAATPPPAVATPPPSAATPPAPAGAPEPQAAAPAPPAVAAAATVQLPVQALVAVPAPVPAPAPARARPETRPQKSALPQKPPAAAAEAEPRPSAKPMFKVANVPSDDVLNVRSGPSADFAIVGGLPPDSRGIAITSTCRSQWCPVQHEATSGWVNSAYLVPDGPSSPAAPQGALHDAPHAPRSCLTVAARALLDRIEQMFGPVQVISTCRPGATVGGTSHLSRHASGNAVDFKAGSRKAEIVQWLIANHHAGGTMTYAGMDHIHVDIGPRFVSIANGPPW